MSKSLVILFKYRGSDNEVNIDKIPIGNNLQSFNNLAISGIPKGCKVSAKASAPFTLFGGCLLHIPRQ